jgi:hypothetical protein
MSICPSAYGNDLEVTLSTKMILSPRTEIRVCRPKLHCSIHEPKLFPAGQHMPHMKPLHCRTDNTTPFPSLSRGTTAWGTHAAPSIGAPEAGTCIEPWTVEHPLGIMTFDVLVRKQTGILHLMEATVVRVSLPHIAAFPPSPAPLGHRNVSFLDHGEIPLPGLLSVELLKDQL